jgi:hypothetical protein
VAGCRGRCGPDPMDQQPGPGHRRLCWPGCAAPVAINSLDPRCSPPASMPSLNSVPCWQHRRPGLGSRQRRRAGAASHRPQAVQILMLLAPGDVGLLARRHTLWRAAWSCCQALRPWRLLAGLFRRSEERQGGTCSGAACEGAVDLQRSLPYLLPREALAKSGPEALQVLVA